MNRRYPRKADITRAVDAAKACGLAVVGIEVAPDGTIKVLGPTAVENSAETDFDKWERVGRL